MRRQVNKEKVKKTFTIPNDLKDFLNEVNQLIQKNDESTTMAIGDALQSDSAYGSVLEENGNKFEFTYLPIENSVDSKWIFILTKKEIENISIGKTQQLEMWACRSEKCYSAFSNKNESCFNCDYEEEKTEPCVIFYRK